MKGSGLQIGVEVELGKVRGREGGEGGRDTCRRRGEKSVVVKLAHLISTALTGSPCTELFYRSIRCIRGVIVKYSI